MKEQLISYKTAKLAKEKGFDLKYTAYQFFYTDDDNGVYDEAYPKRVPYEHYTWLLAPTQSLLQKWLRENYYIHIEINLGHDENSTWYDFTLFRIELGYNHEYIETKEYSGQNTYEDALENGLIEGLKLI